MSDQADDDRDETIHTALGARLAATIAMSQTSARLAFATFLLDAPPSPRLGTPEHEAFAAGKDATLAMALCGLQAEQRHGRLKHLTADDMMEIAAILAGLDTALSRRLGIDVRGNPLQ